MAGASANRMVFGIGGVTIGSSYVSRMAADDGLGVLGAPVEHRGQDAEDLQLGVDELLDVVDGVEQLTHAAVRERLGLQRVRAPAATPTALRR